MVVKSTRSLRSFDLLQPELLYQNGREVTEVFRSFFLSNPLSNSSEKMRNDGTIRFNIIATPPLYEQVAIGRGGVIN